MIHIQRCLLLLVALFSASFITHAQTTAVSGNITDLATLPLTTVTSAQVTFELKNFGGRIPKSGGVAIGGVKIAFKPDALGNFLAWIIHDFASKKRKGALKD
jgi:hypothetical protein